jgi:hypothetical protein
MIKFEHAPTGKSVTIVTSHIASYEFQTLKGLIQLNIIMANGNGYNFNLAALRGYTQLYLEREFEKIIPINNSMVQAIYQISGYDVIH